MNSDVYTPPRWSTSSFGDTAQPTPGELASLGEHLNVCKAHGRLFALQCGALAVHGFAAGRFVTTLAIAAALIGISVLVL
ncbi:MAG: hypothetical protein V4757_19760 [Pseudomonadota bacterium]